MMGEYRKQIAKVAACGVGLVALVSLVMLTVLQTALAVILWSVFALAVMVVFLMFAIEQLAAEPKKTVWVSPLPSDMFSKEDRIRLNRDVGHWEYE